MGIIVKKRPELTWWDRMYLPAIVEGVWITSSHFFRNMFFHTMHLVGLFRHVRAAVTYQYPEESRPTSPRLRTRHRLTKRDDGSPRCVACMMCETVCPARCIYIVAGEHPDPNVEKVPTSFTIDLGKCVYCGYCVEACPEDAIRMDTQIHSIAAYSRDEMILDIKELLNPGSSKSSAKPPASGYFEKTAGMLGSGGKATRALLEDRALEGKGGLRAISYIQERLLALSQR